MIRNTVIFFMLLLLMSCSPKNDPAALKAGQQAPDFRLKTLDHDRFYLNQQTGNAVMLVFWSTWCKSCKSELLDIKKLMPGPVKIVSICIDPENIHDMRQIVKKLEIDCPVLMDNGSEVFRNYQLKAVPATVIIDKNSRIRLIRVGYSPSVMNHIRSAIERLSE